MTFSTDLFSLLAAVNLRAVAVATLAGMIVGMIWYHPKIFGKAWMTYEHISMESTTKTKMILAMVGSLITTFIKATVIALLIGGTGLISGVLFGLLLGMGIIAMNTAMHFLYAQKSFAHYCIEVGYDVIMFVIIGGIVGSWMVV